MATAFDSLLMKRTKTSDQLIELTIIAFKQFFDPEMTDQKIQSEELLVKRLNQIKFLLYGDGKLIEVDEIKAANIAKFSIQV
jgi:hypothetical protein